jgi:hypothetical protein
MPAKAGIQYSPSIQLATAFISHWFGDYWILRRSLSSDGAFAPIRWRGMTPMG